MRVYVAGPMRSIPLFNFPAFAEAAAKLRALGHTVFSPAERDIKLHGGAGFERPDGDESKVQGFSLRDALRDDLVWICQEAEGIALLPGWESSKGANAERATGLALNLSVQPLEVWLAAEPSLVGR